MNEGKSIGQALIERIRDKQAVVGIIGLGYVGLPLAVEMALVGFETIGMDIVPQKVDLVNAGKNYILDVNDEEFKDVIAKGTLRASVGYKDVAKSDCVCICVPTPLDEHQQPDVSFMVSAAKGMAPFVHTGMLVVLESTTYPGTTKELLMPILEEGSGLKCGEDFFLAFSPERVDPSNKDFKTRNIPKVVGGLGSVASDVAATLYRNALQSEIFVVSSPAVAEMAKVLENTYRNINIGLANEMAIICDRMGIDVWEVIDAAKTKPYGFQAFYPGPGIGGHCIPLDPYYLSWKAREFGYHMRLIEIAGEINSAMPRYVVDRASRLLNRKKKSINGANILILGVAYKANIGDWRESPSLFVMDILEKDGAQVSYHDPYVKALPEDGKESVPLTAEVLRSADAVLLLTGHTNVDYVFVAEHANLILDTRNAMKGISGPAFIEKL